MATLAEQFFDPAPQRKLTLSKPDGTTFTGLSSAVTGTTIFVYDGTYPIEVGDTLVGERGDGATDRFYVTRINLYTGKAGIPDHYQVKYSAPPPSPAPSVSNNTFNLNGPQSRAYVASQDQSFNVIADTDTTIFQELRVALPTITNPEARAQAATAVDRLEKSHRTPDFAKMVASFAVLVQKTPEITHALQTFIPKLLEMASSH